MGNKVYKLGSISLWHVFSVLMAYVLFAAITISDCPDSNVMNVAFIPNSSSALIKRSSDEIELWDIDTGKNLPSALSPNTLQYAQVNSTPCISDLPTVSKDIYPWFGNASGMAVSSDGVLVALANRNRTVQIWNLKTEHLECVLSSNLVHSIAFSSDGSKLLTGGSSQAVQLWDLTKGKVVQTFIGHDSEINSVAFSPDNTQILTGSSDGTARIWDVATGDQLAKFENDQPDIFYKQVNSVAYSPDGKLAAMASWDRRVRLWDIKTGVVVSTLKEPISGGVDSVSFSSDGHLMLTTGSWDSNARLWDINSNKIVQVFSGHSDWIKTGAISQNNLYAITGGFDGSARLWNIQTGSQIYVFCPTFIGPLWYVALAALIIIIGLSLLRYLAQRKNRSSVTVAIYRSFRNAALLSLVISFGVFTIFFYKYVMWNFFSVHWNVLKIAYIGFFICSIGAVIFAAYQNYHLQQVTTPLKSTKRLLISAVMFIFLMLILVALFTGLSFFMFPIP